VEGLPTDAWHKSLSRNRLGHDRVAGRREMPCGAGGFVAV